MMPYLVEICFLIYSVATAFIQAALFNHWTEQGKNRSINHMIWGFAYAAYSILIIFALPHDYLNIGYFIILGICAILIRIVFFSPALNLWRKYPKRDFFYFNPDGKSFTDRLIKTRVNYIRIYFISLFALIYLQTHLA